MDRDDVHQYRVRIKRLVYIYNALPNKIQPKIDLNEAVINEQQKKLGDWHDTYSASTFFSKGTFPVPTAQYVEKLKEKEKKKYNALRRSLLQDSN